MRLLSKQKNGNFTSIFKKKNEELSRECNDNLLHLILEDF